MIFSATNMSLLSTNYGTFILSVITVPGDKGDQDFRISDLVKNPDGTDI